MGEGSETGRGKWAKRIVRKTIMSYLRLSSDSSVL